MLLINAKYLTQKITGVQRVAVELTKHLGTKTNIKNVLNPYSGLKGHLYEQCIVPFKVSRKDILISPINLGPIFIKNHIVIVHDTATFDHPEWFSRGFALFYKLLLPTVIKKSTVIVTVSDYSKSRIVDLFNVTPSKVVVIPNGVDPTFFPNNSQPLINSKTLTDYKLIEKKYVLTVCSIEPRKNIPRLIKAWLQSGLPEAGYTLAVAGGAGKNFSNVEAFSHKSIEWLGYVPDEDLPMIYQNARAFAYVSLYEGFGLPPLEAMAAGIPVLSSNVTSLPEVVADYGVMVDPNSITNISQGLNNVLAIEQTKIDEAQKRAKTFTWNKFAEKFIEVINNIEKSS